MDRGSLEEVLEQVMRTKKREMVIVFKDDGDLSLLPQFIVLARQGQIELSGEDLSKLARVRRENRWTGLPSRQISLVLGVRFDPGRFSQLVGPVISTAKVAMAASKVS